MDIFFDNSKLESKAIKLFESGFNCTQSVLLVYSDYFDIKNETASNIACGFGAGMGRLQETCGAVTGAYMVIGFYAGKKNIKDQDKKENAYLMIQTFNERFLEKQKSTNCKTLLNCDLRTDEGKRQFRDKNLKKTVCEKCINDSIKLINEILNK